MCRDGIPLVRLNEALLHAGAALKEDSNIERRIGVAEVRGLAEPARRFYFVLFDPLALEISEAKAVHGVAIAVFGGRLIPMQRLGCVFRETTAARIERAEP